MNAVILCGSPGTALFPLVNEFPKALLPLANEPLLAHALRALRECGVAEVAIVGPAQRDRDRLAIEKIGIAEADLKVRYLEEAQPSGTAGALRGLRSFATSDFLVLGSNILCSSEHLNEIVSFHHRCESLATVMIEALVPEEPWAQRVELAGDGSVGKIHSRHASQDRRRSLKPSGIYVFSPRVLDAIPLQGYMDIREQLIPALGCEGIRVEAYVTPQPVRTIDTVADYFHLNREVLTLKASSGWNSSTEILEGVWVGKRVKVSPRAHLIGPIRIGADCVIEDHVQIVGPTSIGDGARIDECAFVRESVVFAGAHLMARSRVEHSVIAEGVQVDDAASVVRAIVVSPEAGALGQAGLGSRGDPRAEGRAAALGQASPVRADSWASRAWDELCGETPAHYIAPGSSSSRHALRQGGYLATKRVLDVVASGLGLVVLLTLLPAIALAIRFDSRGPAFFRQRRCGQYGRKFAMFKFRTMEHGAEQIQDELAGAKDIDGPMFKLRDDPRITLVGKILRRSGLDELPQLLNVFRGEMSLVGPRPLVMDEMQFAPSWRDIRLQVRPGITGLWQIGDRGDVSFHHWIASDIYYVRHQSLRLDLEVLWKTLLFSVRRSGA